MAFPLSFLLVAEDNLRVGAPADGAGMHPATSDALDFVPVKSKNRSSHSTSQGRGLEAAGSVEITRASSRLRPDRAGQVGLVRPPARSDLPGSSGQQAPLMSSLQLNQSYFAPRGDNSSRPLPNQPTSDMGRC